MARRPVFIPAPVDTPGFVQTPAIEFEWHAGFSLSQKQKSIRALHLSAAKSGIEPILEISSKSDVPAGVALSAFNLTLPIAGVGTTTVEAAFQGSKCFERGGPFVDLYESPAAMAKRDTRLRESGALVAFDLEGEKWPLDPLTAFYDWVYLRALTHNPHLAAALPGYKGFTDIEFNPSKSINCQAQSCALYVSLLQRGLLSQAMSSPKEFLAIVDPTGPADSRTQGVFGFD